MYEGAPENYYSPQALSTRLFQLDLQISNLAVMVKKLYREQQEDQAHLAQLDKLVADLQNQISGAQKDLGS